jgi:hypothetical protein
MSWGKIYCKSWWGYPLNKLSVPYFQLECPILYNIKNVNTGKYITDAGSSNTPVVLTDLGDEDSTKYSFVNTGDFVNINSEVSGVLRRNGSNEVLTTNVKEPTDSSDKVFVLEKYNDFYRIKYHTTNRYIYNSIDDSVTTTQADETDTRSQWELILIK